MLCVRGAQCQFELEEICIEWDTPCYRRQLTHASPLRTQCVCVCVCVYVCVRARARVCVCVCVCARYKWLAGQPPAMNITEHSQLKFKLTGGRFPQSTFSLSVCACVCVCGGGWGGVGWGVVFCFFSTCFIFFSVHFALNICVLGRQYACLCFEMICSHCDELTLRLLMSYIYIYIWSS